MFCSKCGKEISNDTKFCNHCGASQGQEQTKTGTVADEVNNTDRPQTASVEKKMGKGMKIGGIVLLVLGLLAVFGSISNGILPAILKYGPVPADYSMLAAMAAMIVGGIVLIYKSKKK